MELRAEMALDTAGDSGGFTPSDRAELFIRIGREVPDSWRGQASALMRTSLDRAWSKYLLKVFVTPLIPSYAPNSSSSSLTPSTLRSCASLIHPPLPPYCCTSSFMLS